MQYYYLSLPGEATSVGHSGPLTTIYIFQVQEAARPRVIQNINKINIIS